MKVVGYAAELRVRPGESIGFHVSSTEEGYTSRIVRLLHGDDNPACPGFKAPAVTEATSHPGAVQEIRPGSSVRVANPAGLELSAGFSLETWVLPTLHVPEAQVIALGDGPALLLRDGVPTLLVGGAELAADTVLRTGVWYRLVADFVAEGPASLTVTPHDALSGGEEVRTSAVLAPWMGVAWGDLVLGAGFNGKLEAPRVLAGGEVVAAWDFSRDIGSSRVTDMVGSLARGDRPAPHARGDRVRLGRHGGRLAPGSRAVRGDPLPRRRSRRRRVGRVLHVDGAGGPAERRVRRPPAVGGR